MHVRTLLLAIQASLGVCAYHSGGPNVTIVHKTLELDEEHSLLVDQTMEYILQFMPTMEQSRFPVRVWFNSDSGDVTHPLLLTARQRIGAITWQLPYLEGNKLLFELQRTLCPDDSVHSGPSDCAGAGEEELSRGGLTLHVSASCARPAALRLRAQPARDWQLIDTLHLNATLAAPHVTYYQFPEAQDSVRLVVASTDDVCATIAVQPVACPIAQTFEAIQQSILRMSVLRSGGVQLSKKQYPLGFYIVALVAASDAVCTGAEAEAKAEADSSWLWESMWREAAPHDQRVPHARIKHLHYEIKETLTQREYVVGALATLALFVLFYVLFGVLVLAERWPRWYNCVAPRAVLLQHNEAGVVTELDSRDGLPDRERRRRHHSTATFDSSDASDTDSETEDIAHTVSATIASNTSPGTMSPGTTSPGTMSPGTTSPGTTSPGTMSPGTTSPGTTSPGTTSPGTMSPGTTSPGTMSPGTTSPGTMSPGTTSPETMPPVNVVANNGVESSNTNGIISVQTLNEVDATVRTVEQVVLDGRRPFGLPGRLHVAALARRGRRTLAARSQRYLYTLYTVAVFYALPVLQFVAAFQLVLNVSGSLDLCYYNFLCAHPAGALSDFNHVFSNLGYLLLGALYMLQLRRRRKRRKAQPRNEEYGIPAHYGLSASLGAGLMMVALLSASYHVCPNALNFQFDTAFMYVLAVLSMVKIYQARHPDINARAHATFGVLAVLIALVVWGVLGGGPLFWSVFTVLHVFTFLLLSLRIYYVGQFRLEKASLAAAAASVGARAAPLYTPRLVALLLANAVNWAFAIMGLLNQSNIASHLLFVLLCNALLHMLFYLSMKLIVGERVRWYAWVYLAGAAAAWAPALYYFTWGSTDWQSTPAQSRLMNHECMVLRFYDSHDLWHLLSAIALYLTFNALLTWDDGLAAVKRTDIAVF